MLCGYNTIYRMGSQSSSNFELQAVYTRKLAPTCSALTIIIDCAVVVVVVAD